LFLAGSATQGDKIFEVAVPSTFFIPPPGMWDIPQDLERARLIRAWGDIYQGRKLLNDPGEIPNVRGLHWDGEKLLWAYGSSYAVSGHHQPSVGASFLDATGAIQSAGPWRFNCHSQRSRGYMTMNPRTGHVAIGAPITSGNGASPWGLSLYEFATPAATLPPSPVGDQGAVAIHTTALVEHTIDTKQERNFSPYSICGWTAPYDPNQGVFLYPAETTFGSLDFISAVAWVRTATREGVMAFGGLVTGEDPHKWYGPTTCPHGRVDPRGQSVGDYADQQWPMLWIFDPNAFDVAPVPVPLSTVCQAIPNYLSQLCQFGGAWFEPTTRRVYVMECGGRDRQGPYSYCPIVHVFEIRQ